MKNQYKRFSFFQRQIVQIQPQKKDMTLSSLQDIQVSSAAVCKERLFFCARLKNEKVEQQHFMNRNKLYVFEKQSMVAEFDLYNSRFDFVKSIYPMDEYILTFGLEEENNLQSSYLMFFKSSAFDNLDTPPKPDKKIRIGKAGRPLTNFSCFSIAKNLSAFAFGLDTGVIHLFHKCKNVMENDLKKPDIIDPDKSSILAIDFHYDYKAEQKNLNMFVSTKDAIYLYKGAEKRQILHQQGTKLISVSAKGQLYAVNSKDFKILEFDQVGKTGELDFQNEKLQLQCIGNDQIMIVITQKKNSKLQYLYIYDTLNEYVSDYYQFKKVLQIIHCPSRILLLTESNNTQMLTQLVEMDNNQKLEKMFQRNNFKYALKFAENLQYDDPLLAEISRLHGDHFYGKNDFDNAIEQYKETVKHLEPSYVIKRFLDVSKIKNLISYLEHLHEEKCYDKHHTALLLNCYVKVKSIKVLDEFISKHQFDSELFDTETAIKVCKESEHIDLAIKLAQQSKHDLMYLKLLIEDKQDFNSALEYIQKRAPLMKKFSHIREFGQILLSKLQKETSEVLKSLISLSTFRKHGQGKVTGPNIKEKDVLSFLNLNEEDWQSFFSMGFPKPNEFFHLFVQNQDQLEQYLNFLINDVKFLPNEKVVYHNIFEFYIQKYDEYYQENKDVIPMRKMFPPELLGPQQKVMELLKDPSRDDKYDKSQVLMLFKMYNFDTGIIFLCEKLQLHEELLHFYIEKEKFEDIIRHCKNQGQYQCNLWVQALKFFIKKNKIDKIPEILKSIQKVDQLSPLLVLNILSMNNSIPFSLVKEYFMSKLYDDAGQIKRNKKTMNLNMIHVEKSRDEYKTLKTKAQVFQRVNCISCKEKLNLPSIHFLCGHSFHEQCAEKDQDNKYECSYCYNDDNPDPRRILDQINIYDTLQHNQNEFYEELHGPQDKFETIGKYFGQQLFKQKEEKEEQNDY